MRQLTLALPSGRYDVQIAGGLLSSCGALIRGAVGGEKAFVLSDENVFPLYGDTVSGALRGAGYAVSIRTIRPGEASKTADHLFALWQDMAQLGMKRSDVLVALGGGVVGDLGGFAAATYLRGIRFVQLPTSLLAQIDSSVGGKVAVDLPQGKNLAGAFYQPGLVLCDTQSLVTLSDTWFYDGSAEAIKCGLIADAELFRLMEGNPTRAALMQHIGEIVQRCLGVKRAVVLVDEKDTGQRMTLNFGHTIGHAIEKASGYTLSHGHAVAAGMVLMARFGEMKGITPHGTAQRIAQLLKLLSLPTDLCGFAAQDLAQAIELDKKAGAKGIRTVQLTAIGSCTLMDITPEELISFLRRQGGGS